MLNLKNEYLNNVKLCQVLEYGKSRIFSGPILLYIIINILLLYLVYLFNLLPSYILKLVIFFTVIVYILFFVIRIIIILTSKSLLPAINDTPNLEYDSISDGIGVDIIKIILGKNLIRLVDTKYSDSDYNKQDGTLLFFIQLLRNELIQKLGYIIPYIRLVDISIANKNECQIFVRNNIKVAFNVYPNLICIDQIPSDFSKECITENYIIFDKPVYWVKEADIPYNFEGNKFNSIRIIYDVLKSICIKNADEILRISDLYKLLQKSEKVYKNDFKFIDKKSINRKFIMTMSNLIKENISVKDFIKFVLLYNEYYLEQEADKISEKIRLDISYRTQITNRYAKENYILGYELSNEIYKDIIECKSYNQEKTIINKLLNKIDKRANNLIICNKEVRLKLYKIINEVFINTELIAYNEILKNIEIKTIDII